jgi:hypothetical protein
MNISEFLKKAKNKIDNTDVDKNSNAVKNTKPLTKQQIVNRIKAEVKKVQKIKFEKIYIPPVYKIYLPVSYYNRFLESGIEFIEENLKNEIIEKAKKKGDLIRENVEVKIFKKGNLEDDKIEVEEADTFEIINGSIDSQLTDRNEELTIENPKTKIDEREDFKSLYLLEIFENGKEIEESPIKIDKKIIVIGRETTDKNRANVRLKTENKSISSQHMAIRFEAKNDITVEAKHKNITKVGNTTISNDNPNLPVKAKLRKNTEIQIFEFMLKIRFG